MIPNGIYMWDCGNGAGGTFTCHATIIGGICNAFKTVSDDGSLVYEYALDKKNGVDWVAVALKNVQRIQRLDEVTITGHNPVTGDRALHLQVGGAQ